MPASSTTAVRVATKAVLPAIIVLLLCCIAHSKHLKSKRKAMKEEQKLKKQVSACLKVIKEMQIEANFTIKVAYLKFQEQLKRKSNHLEKDADVDQSKATIGGGRGIEDIYLQPNFEKHINLFKDFKHVQLSAALQRHGISLSQFDSLLASDQELQAQFDGLIHFPFIGLVKEKGQTSFEGAAVLARPPSLPLKTTQCSPQSLRAVLKKYYTSLLFKLIHQVHQKKTMYERFQLILALLIDSKELAQVFELYGLKLSTNTTEIEEPREPISVFQEANKAYYSYVLDRAWADDMRQTELNFWELLGLILEHGHKLKSSFWQANPLQSKQIGFCKKELEALKQTLDGFTSMLSQSYVYGCQTRLVNLVQIALQSAYCLDMKGDSDNCSKVEIVRNQVVFGAHHCQSAFVTLRKLHDIAQTNATVSHSHSRMQGGEAKIMADSSRLGAAGPSPVEFQDVRIALEQEENNRRKASGGFGQKVAEEEMKIPEGELSRVESPPVTERSNFVGTAYEETEDAEALLNQGGALMAQQAITRESHVATSELITGEQQLPIAEPQVKVPVPEVNKPEQQSNSNRASFKQQRQRKQRTPLTQKLALSNQLKNMIDKHKTQEVEQSSNPSSQVDK